MTRLENLPEIASRRLGGLTADARLLNKIKQSAAPAKPRVRWMPFAAGFAAAALCLCVGLWAVPTLWHAPDAGDPANTLMGSDTAGGKTDDSVQIRALDVPAGSISVGSSTNDAGTYRNIFAPEHNGNFPLILVGNAAYRMLISPTNMKENYLGDSLGEVTEYTLEPALSSGGIVSNIVSAGDTVYEIDGMKGKLAAAYVKGSLRVFQRVSYAGTSILGNEKLADTLASADQITAMELTGAGVINDAATAQSLMQTLLDNAQYESASIGTDDKRSLLIGLSNGLIIQLMVGDENVSACGTWSCPEFFEAYNAAVQ